MRSFLEREFGKPKAVFRTLSIVEYHSGANHDMVFHNVGLNRYSVREHMFGPEGDIKSLWDGDRVCKTLLGTEDAQQGSEVYDWVVRKNPV